MRNGSEQSNESVLPAVSHQPAQNTLDFDSFVSGRSFFRFSRGSSESFLLETLLMEFPGCFSIKSNSILL
jgi:hypothetical protein